MLAPASTFSRRLLAWYDRARRDLPWRAGGASGRAVTAYHILVSELMLQQTQVAAVIPYFQRFIERYPTIADLAAADDHDVLRLWQGLGYYARARNLLAAARQVAADHAGALPSSVEALLALPGIGRYTAGAIASIAFEQRAPILDGNVMRVLCRLEAVTADPRDRATLARLWTTAEAILPRRRIGDFNSALMELGALVCTPRSPQCLICPVRRHCRAYALGIQDRIPAPKKAKPTPLLQRTTYCIRSGDRWLIEQRLATGRWAGMWQFVTLPENAPPPPGLCRGDVAPAPLGTLAHALTHRRYQFTVYVCQARPRVPKSALADRRWTRLVDLSDFALPRPHLKIAEMLRALPAS